MTPLPPPLSPFERRDLLNDRIIDKEARISDLEHGRMGDSTHDRLELDAMLDELVEVELDIADLEDRLDLPEGYPQPVAWASLTEIGIQMWIAQAQKDYPSPQLTKAILGRGHWPDALLNQPASEVPRWHQVGASLAPVIAAHSEAVAQLSPLLKGSQGAAEYAAYLRGFGV